MCDDSYGATSEEISISKDDSTADSTCTPPSQLFRIGVLDSGTVAAEFNLEAAMLAQQGAVSGNPQIPLATQDLSALNPTEAQPQPRLDEGKKANIDPDCPGEDGEVQTGPTRLAQTLKEVHEARSQAGARLRNSASKSTAARISLRDSQPDSPRFREPKRTPASQRLLGVAFKSPKVGTTRPALQTLRQNVPRSTRQASVNSLKQLARHSSARGDQLQVIHEHKPHC
jgi:hypothetical protein